MKTEDLTYASDIRLNKYGSVDVEYYYARAKQMRAECSIEMLLYAKNLLKSGFNSLVTKLAGSRLQTSH